MNALEALNQYREELIAEINLLSRFEQWIRSRPGEVESLPGKPRRNGKAKKSISSNEAAKVDKSRKPAFELPPMGRRKSGLADAIRTIAAKLKPNWSRRDVTVSLEADYPDFTGKQSETAVILLDMLQRGEVSREGSGSLARYTVVKLKGENEKPRSLGGIHVPRELAEEAA